VVRNKIYFLGSHNTDFLSRLKSRDDHARRVCPKRCYDDDDAVECLAATHSHDGSLPRRLVTDYTHTHTHAVRFSIENTLARGHECRRLMWREMLRNARARIIIYILYACTTGS